MSRTVPVLELRLVSDSGLRDSLQPLRGYLKFASMVWIRALRQPILDGLLVKQWTSDTKRSLGEFCRRHGSDEILLRVDSLNQRWSERRGGYIISQSEAHAAFKQLKTEGKIAAFLEPLSPYRDRYSLAAIVEGAQSKMVVEVVGPGFDASDLMRGDAVPHETFEVGVSRKPRDLKVGRQTHLISTTDYKRSVEERLVKIGARLRNPAYPKMIVNSEIQRNRLIKEAFDYLRLTKQHLLLDRLDLYEPVPKPFLERFVRGVGRLVGGLAEHNVHLGPISVSGSFTSRGRFVFWDFFPANVSEAERLYLG